ncbi:MAG: FHA domain-containing protein [Planctomycetes bacterium]|jgi:predicted S18 family serine protease|nr:FHA domain-containing protein [Planctomycetota bacterium]
MTKPSFVLRITRAKQSPTETEHDQPRLTIGREAGDLVMQDPGTSSKHAEILFADGIVKLRDVGSTNGTWQGSRKVTDEVMAPGVVYTLGGSSLELVEVKGLETPMGTLVMPNPRAAAGTEVKAGTAVQNRPAPIPPQPVSTGHGGPTGSMPAAQKRNLMVGIGAIALIGVLAFVFRGGGANGGGGGNDPGSNGGGGKTTATGKLTATREANVKAVWFRGPIGPQASGGTSPTNVRISPNDKGRASVGTTEQFAGGAGNQWKTATWLAAFSSSRLCGRNLTDHEFLVGTGGHIDGPSAGMLMTATMVALLRGKTPRADTTMTGTINPDGSAGPVGGIVQKMDGAKKDGIKRFGFPMGGRNHTDLRTGRTVDLFEVGKEFGLEVREIQDVFQAYEFLTDDKLERPTPVAESEMELDSETLARLRGKSEKWRARIASEIANIGSFARGLGELGKNIQPIAARADEAYKQAQGFEKSDFLASALESYVQAAVLAGITKDAARFLQSAQKQDFDDMVAQVRAAASVRGQLSAMLSEAELLAKRKTGGGQINTLRAYHSAVVAEAFLSMADNAVANVDKLLEARQKGTLKEAEQEKLPELMFGAITYFSITKTMIDVAEDQKDFGNEEGQGAPIAAESIGNFAAAYGSAAGAVLQYLESLTLEEAARDAGVDKGTLQNRLAANDENYLVAFRAVQLAEGITDQKTETNLLRLAAGSMAFLKGASLVNKYYSLGGTTDESGTLVLSNRKALSTQLDLARLLAREAAAKSKQVAGYVPVAARLAYQLGLAKREGDDEEKLAALESLWESAFWCELAASSPAAKK